MKRRRFIGSVLAGMGGAILGCRESSDVFTDASTDARVALAEGASLRTPAILANESAETGLFSATLRAAPFQATLRAGETTAMLAYNDSSPGPLIELREGQHVRITLDNDLAQDTTIHWHGLPVPPDQDGNPMDPVPGGGRRVEE